MSSTAKTTRLNCKAIPFIGESAIEKPPSPNGRSILSRSDASRQPPFDHCSNEVRREGRSCGVCGARRGFIDGTNSPRLARLQSQALLFLIGWDRSGRWLRHRHGLRFRRGYRSPKLWSCAITSPQLSTLDLADEFAPHRFFRLDLQQRLVAGLERSTLGVCTCRKTNCGKNNKGLHCHFPFAFGAGTITRPSLKTACDGCRDW